MNIFDGEVYRSILQSKTAVEASVNSQSLLPKILELSENIAKSTGIGPGNVIVTGVPFTDLLGDKKPNESFNGLEEDVTPPMALEKFTFVVTDHLKEDEMIIARRGDRDSETGFILCPYNAIMPVHAGGSSTYSIMPVQAGGSSAYSIMTRYGIVDNLVGSTDFYEVIKLV